MLDHALGLDRFAHGFWVDPKLVVFCGVGIDMVWDCRGVVVVVVVCIVVEGGGGIVNAE